MIHKKKVFNRAFTDRVTFSHIFVYTHEDAMVTTHTQTVLQHINHLNVSQCHQNNILWQLKYHTRNIIIVVQISEGILFVSHSKHLVNKMLMRKTNLKTAPMFSLETIKYDRLKEK